MNRAAGICIVPMQDYLALDNRSRMNKPSTVGTNWLWRIQKEDLTPKLGAELRQMAARKRVAAVPVALPEQPPSKPTEIFYDFRSIAF